VNGGHKIFSESLIVQQPTPPKREFVVVWQNALGLSGPNGDLARIRDIIQKTMHGYNP
jgi:hypothetical protein